MPPERVKPTKVTIHCSATPNGQIYSIEQIRKDHIARGFSDIGYHIVIQPTGDWDNTRALNEPAAHVQNHNKGNVGICLIGNDRFSKRQFDVLRVKLDAIKTLYDVRPWEFHCHYLFDTAIKQGKTCPNFSVQRLLTWYLTGDMKALENVMLK